MKKKILIFGGILLGIILVCAGGLYALAARLYSETFSYNTVINGIYCTGKTPEEVNAELISQYEKQDIEIVSEYGSEFISMSDIGYTVDYSQNLSFVFAQRSGWLWITGLFGSGKEYVVEPNISFSEELLIQQVYSTKIYRAYMIVPDSKVQISPDSRGYSLNVELYKTLDSEGLIDKCAEAVYSHEIVNVDASGLIQEPSYTGEMNDTLTLWGVIDEYLSLKIIFDMGDEKIGLSKADLKSFIIKDSSDMPVIVDGKVQINEEAVYAYVDRLCDKYDTYELPRTYVTYSGETKEFLENNHYGTLINRESEKEYLLNQLTKMEDDLHVPKYKKKPYHRGLNDIGPEFIEVDLTNQTLIYVKNGEILLETKVVTGKPSQGTPTPEMVCYVYKKNTDTYLKGTDYYTHVDYWMAIYKKIGLHDATWQRSFGGTRYLKHGSHGCVNMPLSKAEELYNLIEAGIPVIVYK